MAIETQYKKVIMSGKRKRAVAKAVLTQGDGLITFNGKNYKTLHSFDKLKIEEPLRICQHVLGHVDFSCELTVKGGGCKSQIDAARLALAKSMVEFTKSDELAKAFSKYDRNLLIADVRRKETCKPGDSKARSKRQSSKR